MCLKSGVHIRTPRIETRDGRFILYPEGTQTPLEFPADQIKSVGVVPCDGTPPPPTPVPVVQKFGIHGSNTIGERLMPMLIGAFDQKHYGAAAVPKPGEHPEEQTIEIRSSSSSQPIAIIDLQAKGSGTAAKALLEKKAVVGMSSRRANADEAAQIKAQYNVDLLAPGNEHVLALDGLAVIVNQANPIKQLSLETIARIFACDITSWKDVSFIDSRGQQVSGPDRPIQVHARNDKSGTYDTFVALVLNPVGKKICPQATRYESSENLSDAVAKDPDSIGFIGLPYINKNHPLGISSSCGIISSPSKFTVKTEQYPLARRLYLYSIGTPRESIAQEILQFALSDDAQPTVIEAEFVDQAVEFQDATAQRQALADLVSNPRFALPEGKDVPPWAVSQFQSRIGSTRRTTVVYRFDYNSSQLDAKVVQDIERLARYLQSPVAKGRPFLIVGFADAAGGWDYNLRLSIDRARRVASELQNLGVRVTRDNVTGFSYMAPVACNDATGQAKNRRVEVWIGQ